MATLSPSLSLPLSLPLPLPRSLSLVLFALLCFALLCSALSLSLSPGLRARSRGSSPSGWRCARFYVRKVAQALHGLSELVVTVKDLCHTSPLSLSRSLALSLCLSLSRSLALSRSRGAFTLAFACHIKHAPPFMQKTKLWH